MFTVANFAGAFGSLAAASVGFFAGLGLQGADAYRPLFVVYALVGLVNFAVFITLSDRVELAKVEGERKFIGIDANVDLPSPWNTGSEGFIGVWDDEKDDGDVPPRSMIKGRSTGIVHPAGVTFNARDGEVIAPDAVWNGLFTFLKPELFKRNGPAEAGHYRGGSESGAADTGHYRGASPGVR